MTQLGRRWSLTTIATVMLGATALSGPAFAQAQDRGGFDLHRHFAQNFTPDHRGGGGSTGGGSTTQQSIDPGPRGGSPGAGGPLPGLSQNEQAFFTAAADVFGEVETVAQGLGPRFNLDSCGGCHAQPALGGSSPASNPQATVPNNTIPSFITANGPIREVRFVNNPNGTPDGGVHDLFVITGRSDAQGCNIQQPNFAAAVAANNAIFRIPTPTFGLGYVEAVPDSGLQAAFAAAGQQKRALGISGSFNRNGNDGTITRFGWKAQNKSLLIFAGEAYNVEQGVSNEVFTQERPLPGEGRNAGLPSNCKINATPEDITHFNAGNLETSSDAVQFAIFMRLTAPPTPSTTVPGGATSISNGRSLFTAIGCAACHTTSLTTSASNITPGLGNATANLFSDLEIHHMGNGLNDNVGQGGAGGDQFRSAPLWGVGQRIFFLHDGRTSNLFTAIAQHASSGSEANSVIANFNSLTATQKQNLVNFLRSL